jgi:hypothetical protein
MDLGNVVPSWDKRYPFSIRNRISAPVIMMLSLTTQDERSLGCVKITSPKCLRKVSTTDIDQFHEEIYSEIYEFKLASKMTERIVLAFCSNESDDMCLYHDIWLTITSKPRKFLYILSPMNIEKGRGFTCFIS